MVVEQGFRYDLEDEPEYGYEEEGVGEFREMVEAQRRTGGFLLEKSPLDLSPPKEKVHALLDTDADNGQEPMFNLTENFHLCFHSFATIIVIAHSGLQWVPIPNTLRYGTDKTCFKVLINPNFWNNIASRKIWVIDTQNFFSRPKGMSNFPYKLFALFLLLIFCHVDIIT